MSFGDFMSKIRRLDNQMAKWIMRHFYILFFEVFLVAIFVALFIITIKVIDISCLISQENMSERLVLLQTFNSVIIVLLLLLNSFWMLYMFKAILRMQTLLRDMNFNLFKHNKN